ncbi:GntR family transcriptional regulator [Sphingomonas crusticola]|uniref:GntR family transcriptional regulator n=1 Tax=Sphingomonas crusticola TaxID=1697973 RepID=UPI0013C347C7|nr:GntR family transcriptional regulator [Sphingomonas crusticola]
MNAGPVSDRVYAALRARILGHRHPPGERLDAAELADRLTSSVTPVRDALNRLAGEGLVEAHSGDGFFLPAFDEPGLADLYRWSSDLMSLVLRQKVMPRERRRGGAGGASNAERIAGLFAGIAALSDNIEHGRAVARCSARLSAARMVEAEIFPDLDEEFAQIDALDRAQERVALGRILRHYHARRVKRAGALVRLLYRAGQDSPR